MKRTEDFFIPENKVKLTEESVFSNFWSTSVTLVCHEWAQIPHKPL